MSNGAPDTKKRGYLLPAGCKDLLDVLKRKPSKKPLAGSGTLAIHPISTEHVFVNAKIRASEVRVCDEAGVVLGVFRLPEALALAERRSMDLVVIDAKVTPYLCVLIDYGKYQYEQSKKKKRKDNA
jgi:Translation initiation factor IF-3, N-terminal domain